MLKMVDGTGIIGVDMVCPLGGTVSPPQPPNFDKVEMEGVGSLMLPNSLKAPLERVELIGNSVQGENPAPDNPQEIKSAGRKSKNLFNIADLRVGQVQKDGTINEKSTRYRTATLDVPEDAKYRITFKTNTDYNMIYFTDAYINGVHSNPYVKVYGGNSGSLISLKNGKNILSFRATKDDATIDFPKDHNIMIAAESETLDYEPYGYFFDVKVTGKNLLNLQKEPDVKGTYQGWKVGDSKKTIVLSIKDKGNNVDITKCSIGVSGNGINPNDGLGRIVQDGTILRSEIKTTNPYVTIYPPNETAVQKFLDRFEIQVEYGTTATPYEPYTEQSMQIALDEPLRGIGEYKDVLTKDGGVRKIKRIVFDENTPFKEYNAPVQVKTTSFISGTTIKDATGEIGIEVMSDRFKAKDIGFDRYDEECITLFGKNIFVRFNKDKNINTAEALTEWLKQNPLTVDYVLAEPVIEPLPESVQAQLAALYSENGTTHVFVDSGKVEAGIKLTYRKEK